MSGQVRTDAPQPAGYTPPENILGLSQEIVHQTQDYQQGWGQRSQRLQADLKAATDLVHQHGLPNLTITSADGSRLIGYDQKTHSYVSVDGTMNGNGRYSETAMTGDGRQQTQSKHNATVNPDGSGTYTVGRTDGTQPRSGSEFAADILKDRGITSPTPTQIANFEQQIEKANGVTPQNAARFWSHLRPDQQVKVPGSTTGDHTPDVPPPIPASATPGTRGDDTNTAEKLQDAEAAMYKYAHNYLPTSPWLNQQEIQDHLRTETDPKLRAGLQYLNDHFGEIAHDGNPPYVNIQGIKKFAAQRSTEMTPRSGVTVPAYPPAPTDYLPIPDPNQSLF